MPVEREFDSHYRYVLVAARRARQLQQGAEPLIASHATKPQKIAQEEIKAGLVGYIRGKPRTKAPIDSDAVPRFVSH